MGKNLASPRSFRPLVILHVVHSLKTGGMENGLVNLINLSNHHLFEHRICCLARSGATAAKLQRPVFVDELHFENGNSVRCFARLVRYIHTIRPDIVHTRTWGGIDGIIAATVARVPVIVHGEHGFLPEDPYGHDLKRRWIRLLLSPMVNHFITVSHDLQRWLQSQVGVKRPVTTILNGVNTDLYRPSKDSEYYKAQYGLKGCVVVGAVGRLDAIKRYDLLIRAFCDLPTDRLKVVLIIVGDGPMRGSLEELKNRVDRENRVHFMGERHDLPIIYRMMDIFVQPSDNEGISNTVLEAMASGIPIIATAVGGNNELVKEGLNGMLVPPGEIQGLRRALRRYLEKAGDRELHGRNARRDAVERFSLERMVREYEDLYLSLTRRKGKRMGSRFRTKD